MSNIRNRIFVRLFAVVLLPGLLLATAGCEESVDAITGTDIAFTIWGFLDAAADTQYVRVFEVTDQLIPDRDAQIDARVFSTNLATSQRIEWKYERVHFDSLITGHFFMAAFRPEHEERYLLEVVRSDGETASAEVTVPPAASFTLETGAESVLIPVFIDGDVPNLIGLRVTYHAINVPPPQAWPQGTPVAPAVQLPVIVSYDDRVERIAGGWRFTIDMERDFDIVRRAYQINCLISDPEESAPYVWLRKMEFSGLLADSSWAPPGGVFDANLLAVPGTFSNVMNGYGFFGAGEGIGREWTPATETSLDAGYNFQPRCTGLFATDTPECHNPPMPCISEIFQGIEGFAQGKAGNVLHPGDKRREGYAD